VVREVVVQACLVVEVDVVLCDHNHSPHNHATSQTSGTFLL
jgi:hypothetical protein